jgi:hypothetical protein
LTAVDSSGAGEARVDEGGVTNAADQTILVPGTVGDAHHVAVGDAQSAAFADFDAAQLEFDGRRDAAGR